MDDFGRVELPRRHSFHFSYRMDIQRSRLLDWPADSTTKCTAVEGSIENLLWCAES
jgi:hypothetical protein